MKKRYFRLSNLIDWIIYVVSIFFVFNPCISYETDGCKGQSVSIEHLYFVIIKLLILPLYQCWQWPVGSFLITSSWLNLLSYFQHIPFFGIYILMFGDILYSASVFGLLLIIFIGAFGLGFHILFINHVSIG